MIGFAAHLRVYEPIGSLPEAERPGWARYVEAGAPSRPVLMQQEHELAVAAAARRTPVLTLAGDAAAAGRHAYVRHVDGLTYLSPWRLQQRAWAAVEDFRSGLPEQIADAFIPPLLAAAAATDADRWRAEHPQERVPIRSVGWQVPVTWFALFDADERRLVLGDRRAAGRGGLDRSLVYLTAMSRARRRVARALHVVERTVEGTAGELLADLGRWLEEFHPHSLVELDYGGLVQLLDDETLSADVSAADIAAALECLAEGDGDGAGEHYERVAGRWRAVAGFERVN